MGEQQRFGRPPTEVVCLRMSRVHGRWLLTITSRNEGELDTWQRLDLADLSTVDLLEAARVELERRLI